jgi:hypothetical protein
VLTPRSLLPHFCSSLVPPFVVICHPLHKFLNLALFHLTTTQQTTHQHPRINLVATAIMVSTQTADAQHICPRCTEVATKLCGGCKEIGYCSLECQQADWPVQKNLCKSFQDFAGPRPAPEMRRVVVFHPEEKKPRFMWAPLLHDEWGWGCGRVCPADLLDYHSNNITWKALETRKNIWTGKDLGYAIQMWFDDNWCNNFSDTNYAVVATTQDQDPAKWSGPIVVTCQTLARGRIEFSGNSVRSNEMLDMDLLAYSHLAGFMVDFYNDSQSHSFRKGPKVQCVEMACGQGDNSTEVHSLVHVPRSHPMFQGRGVLSEISKVCFPLSRIHQMDC